MLSSLGWLAGGPPYCVAHRQGFDQAQQDRLDLLNQECAKAQNQRECVLSAYRKRAESYRSQLEGDALTEARLSPEKHAQIQQKLIVLGLLDDTPDGEFGSNTRAAIKKFQQANGFEPSGYLTARQQEVLTASTGPRIAPEVNGNLSETRGPENLRDQGVPTACADAGCFPSTHPVVSRTLTLLLTALSTRKLVPFR
jgi:hypothetical protein